MKDYKIPYTVIGISFNKREISPLIRECERTSCDRSEVIKKALTYWLSLDVQVRDGV